MSVKIFLRHVNKLPRHCAPGVDRYLKRIGKTRDDISGPNAPGVDGDFLLKHGGQIAKMLVEIAEREQNGKT